MAKQLSQFRIIKNGNDFNRAMRDIAQAMQEDFEIILRKLALDAFRSVVRRTPVDYGYLRNNWDIVVDSTPPEQPKAEQGKKKYTAPKAPSFDVKFNSIIIIYNNTKYAIYIEEGTPKMQAQPMVRPTEEMLRRTAEKLATALSKKGYKI